MRYRIALIVIAVIMAGGAALLVFSKPPAPGTRGIDGIRFDTAGWKPHDVSLSRKMWKNTGGDVLGVEVAPEFPSIVLTDDATSMREQFRRFAARGDGDLVESEASTVAGRPAAMLIYKRKPLPPHEYVGMLFVRNGADHFTFTTVSTEREGDDAADEQAPTHPLSKVRATLRTLQRTIAFQP